MKNRILTISCVLLLCTTFLKAAEDEKIVKEYVDQCIEKINVDLDCLEPLYQYFCNNDGSLKKTKAADFDRASMDRVFKQFAFESFVTSDEAEAGADEF